MRIRSEIIVIRGTAKPYQILMEMSAQASRVTLICSQYVWGIRCVLQKGKRFTKKTTGKMKLKLRPTRLTMILTIVLGVKTLVYLKGEQMAM